jgi:acyl-homoserine lactone acylase PvdQ
VAVTLGASLAIAPSSSFAVDPEPFRHGDYGGSGFRNVLPPGTNGLANANDAAQFQCCSTYPPHSRDQYAMYRDLVYATPGLTAGDVPKYFKDASFGVQNGQAERVYRPNQLTRPEVVIVRDRAFGVPHVYGLTRSDVIYGAGYAAAEDRLFFIDVLRHAGRGQLSGFAGGANKEMDVEQWRNAAYSEADLQRQIDQLDNLYGAVGAQVVADGEAYIEGVNDFITLEARINPNKMPVEYAAIQKPLEDFQPTDVIAIASLIGAIFGKGGGGEVESAQVLTAARQRFGAATGSAVWQDFRRAEDPEAPTTVRSLSFPYQVQGTLNNAAQAIPDEGSVKDGITTTSTGPPAASSARRGSASRSASAGLGLSALRDGGNSNALLISGAESDSGHPVAVMGPQVSYFIPEILMEQDLHCVNNCSGGPDIDVTGASFPGISPYVLLGRGKDYAWSATSAGQDIIDTFAERLCEPSGGTPTIDSTHYLYKGQCVAMETLTRTNNITPNAADPSPAETFTIRAHRTVHGIVHRRGRVGNTPVAFARQRSTYFHEVDSARAFVDMNSPQRVASAQQFQQAMSQLGFTFNWFYADDRDIAYFNSGDNPVRATGVSQNFPNWGTGQFDWRNFNRDARTADYTPFDQHPRVINQSFITSWNNKQARGYRAADDNFAYGPIHRSLSLDRRVEAGLAGSGKMNRVELIDAMEDAGTVDLRGSEVLPWMLRVVGNPTDPQLADAVARLRGWVQKGAHRIDRDANGWYEQRVPISILDAWWPLALEAQFKPALGQTLFDRIQAVMGFDDEPNNGGAHLGSAYIDGWYGYAQKDLRRLLGEPVAGPLSRIYCGGGNLAACRTALRESLRDALAIPEARLYDEDPSDPDTDRVDRCPARFSSQWCFDAVRFRPLGAIEVNPIHWINRPTFQQAVEISKHRPRP